MDICILRKAEKKPINYTTPANISDIRLKPKLQHEHPVNKETRNLIYHVVRNIYNWLRYKLLKCN